jgi:hypothetical protein
VQNTVCTQVGVATGDGAAVGTPLAVDVGAADGLGVGVGAHDGNDEAEALGADVASAGT